MRRNNHIQYLQKESSHIAVRNIKWYSHCGNSLATSQKLELPNYLAFLLLGISLRMYFLKACSHKSMDANGYSKIIHNGPKVETSQMSTT
jgi:hypothetical protein